MAEQKPVYIVNGKKVDPDGNPAGGGSDGGDDLSSKSVEELEALAGERGVTVEGTGSNGRVLKADLLKALAA